MIRDLSLVHKPAGTIFREPRTPGEWAALALLPAQIEFFEINGYVSGIRLLDSEQVAQLRAELAEISDPSHPANDLYYEFSSNESADPEKVLFHALGAWRITPGFHDVLWNPAFLKPASQLLGNRPVRFWHDQIFSKPAHHGGVVAWHQDYSYWTRTHPMQHLTCWVGLDDADTSNGCLHYVPGSHRWGLLNKPELAGNMNGIFQYLTPQQQAEFKPVPIPLKAGYATFHHPLMLHGSYENTSPHARRAFVINVFADGTCSGTDDPLLAGVPPIAAGNKMDGQFFPLLYAP